MISPQRMLHRRLRSLGLHVQRWRDPYRDAAAILRREEVRHIVDGGAYHGSAARRMLSLFPSATIHCFEPQQESADFLRGVFANERRVQIEQSALSDRAGEATLYVNRAAFTTSLLETTDTQSIEPLESRQVGTVTLDAWAQQRGIASVPLLKLDLQGHELAALRGARRLLSAGTQAVISEVNFRERYAGTCLFHEVASFLHEIGFGLHRLYEIIPAADGGWQLADALFVRNSRPQPEAQNGREA